VLTNAGHGWELATELVEWALDAYAGVAEAIPEPLDLTPENLAAYTGEYESQTGVITVIVDGNLLRGSLRVNPGLTLEQDEVDELHRSFPFAILPDDEFLIMEGMYKGLRGAIVRDHAGAVTGLDLGRVFVRRA
jgi:hypothetical protein